MNDHPTPLDRAAIPAILDSLYGDSAAHAFHDVPPEPDTPPEYEGLADLLAVVRQLKQAVRGLPRDLEHVYGELTPASVHDVIDRIPGGLGAGDVFVDLGSGIGKVCVQVFLATTVGACRGIELSAPRHRQAEVARQRLQADYPAFFAAGRGLHFVQGDILAADIGDATVVFLCARLFGDALMTGIARKLAAGCPRLRHVLSTREFPFPGLAVSDTLTVHSAYAPQGESLWIYSA